MNYKLTILILTIPSRLDRIKDLLNELNYQIQTKPVQIIYLGDNKSMTVGEKRNLLKSMAKGDFICYIDDDDSISYDYIDVILKAIDENQSKTVITFRGEQTTNGIQDLPFIYNLKYGRNFKGNEEGKRWKLMIPDHLCVWNRSKIKEDFPHKNLAEDHDWAKAMAFTYTESDQVLLTDTLYYYNYNKNTSECRK